MVENTGSIEALLQEDRSFPPPEGFVPASQHARPLDLRRSPPRP